MRRAYRGQEIIYTDDGLFYGINLGADFTAEHEYGIKDIQRNFGIDSNKVGIDGRSITEIPNTIVYGKITIDKIKYTYLICYKYEFSVPKEKITKKEIGYCELSPYSKDCDIYTSWDGSSFGILVSEKYKKELELLYNAFMHKDIVIGISPGHVFKNGGLKFLIKSMLSEDIVNSVMLADVDQILLKNKAEETGIYKILEKAGKRFYALSPKWEDEDKKDSVVFWLNPCEQQKYNYGWFTVEDLKDWAKDKGKIMMDKNCV